MPSHLAHTLIAQGLLSQDKAEEALRHQAAQGGTIDTALLERRLLPEAQVLHALGEASGQRPVNLADFEPNADVASFIPPKIAERLCVVPLSLDGSTLHVACGYPVPQKELDEVGFLLGKSLELWVATEVRIREWISVIYRQPLAPRYTSLLASLDPERPGTAAPPAAQPQVQAQPAAAPAPKPAASTAPAPAPKPATTAAPAPRPAASTAPVPAPKPAAPAPRPPAPDESALTLEMVERLARSVAAEPIAVEDTKPVAPPAQPQRGNGTPPAPAPHAAPAQPARPAPQPAPPAAVPPPAFTREPLRLNMSEPARPAAPAQPPQAPAAPVARPAAPPAQPQARPAAPAITRPPVPPQAQPPVPAPQPVATPGGPQPRPLLEPRAPEAAAPQSPRDDVPEWTLAQARAALKESTRDRDRLIDTALRFGRRTFDYVAAFAVLRGAAVGWDSRGEGLGSDKLSLVSVPLDASSVFRTVAITRGSYAGPMPPDSLTKHYLELFGRQPPRTLFLYPVEVRGRLVAVLYGDCGQKPISQRRLSDYILFCQDLPAAFQELILFRKQRLGELRNSLDFDVDVDEQPASSTGVAPSAPSPAMAAGLGWSPFVTRSANALGRAAAMAPLVMSQEERPPPDFGPILKRLTGPDANQRSSAMAELARSPEASAKVLATHFPGPTAWSRLPVVDLPEADELGPIPGALSRLGRPAAQALAPLLDSSDADTRYFALLTAGSLPYAELVDGVLRGLFDYEPDISSAARVASAALKHLPRLDAAKKELRQELSSGDALRRSLAARALGTLHDREAIEGLIQLTGSDDEMCAQAAAEALREVTRATFGMDSRAWMAWWADNRQRRRADWLVSALRHPELDIRLAAIEELSRGLNDTLGYYADAPEPEREAAVRRWEAAVADPARARRLALL
jgi:hypothetical protein